MLLHDGQVLASETVTDTIRESAALRHTVTEEGYYQCFARNDAGCEEWTTFAVRGVYLFALSLSLSRIMCL